MIITLISLIKDRVSIDGLMVDLGPYEIRVVSHDGDVSGPTARELESLVNKGYLTYTTGEDPDIPDDFEDVRLSMMHSFLKVRLIDSPNVGGGGTTVTVGFSLRNIENGPFRAMIPLEFAVFDDQWGTFPAANATLDTASKGAILDGGGSAALKVLTDANGEFECTLTDLTDETVWIGCSQSFFSPSLSCLSKDSITFSA